MDYVQVRLKRKKYLALRELDPSFGEDENADPRLVEWTYDGFLDHMVGNQDLTAKSELGVDSTAINRVRYAKFLEKYEPRPVKLRPPNEESYVRHMAYRRGKGEVGAPAVEQYRRTMVSLLRFLGIPRWECLAKKPRGISKKAVRLPPRHLVPKFWTEIPCKFRYRRIVLQHVNHLVFNSGIAPPAEVCGLLLDDIEWDARCLLVRRPKKWGDERLVYGLEPEVFRMLRVFVDQHRRRSSRPEVYVTASGTPWSPPRLGALMGETGRMIWPGYRPYTGRHWYINESLRLGEYKNLYEVARVTGSSVESLMESYIDHAGAAKHATSGRKGARSR